jgi:hypothetical protein
MRLLKVVDVAPVWWKWPGLGMFDSVTLYQCMFTRAGWTQCKEVIAFVLDANAEPDRIDCPWLADDFRQIFQFLRGIEVELLQIAALIQEISFKSFDGHIAVLGCRLL